MRLRFVRDVNPLASKCASTYLESVATKEFPCEYSQQKCQVRKKKKKNGSLKPIKRDGLDRPFISNALAMAKMRKTV